MNYLENDMLNQSAEEDNENLDLMFETDEEEFELNNPQIFDPDSYDEYDDQDEVTEDLETSKNEVSDDERNGRKWRALSDNEPIKVLMEEKEKGNPYAYEQLYEKAKKQGKLDIRLLEELTDILKKMKSSDLEFLEHAVKYVRELGEYYENNNRYQEAYQQYVTVYEWTQETDEPEYLDYLRCVENGIGHAVDKGLAEKILEKVYRKRSGGVTSRYMIACRKRDEELVLEEIEWLQMALEAMDVMDHPLFKALIRYLLGSKGEPDERGGEIDTEEEKSAVCNLFPDYSYNVYQEADWRMINDVADLGSAEANYQLAMMYDEGEILDQNSETAFWYYLEAAKAGNLQAMYIVGCDYYDGKIIDQDGEEAVRWLQIPAENDHSRAQFILAECYRKGLGVTKDATKAVSYYEKAAFNEFSRAYEPLAECYYEGEGIPQDYNKAAEYFLKAEASADSHCTIKAISTLGDCYAYGRGVKTDYEKAVYYYTIAAGYENPKAQLKLGYCYANGVGVQKDGEEALRWIRSAAENGDSAAQCVLGDLYFNEGRKAAQDYEAAFRWYSKAAEEGDNSYAKLRVGECYEFGIGVELNLPEAVRWYTEAAEAGFAKAKCRLGACYYYGIGVEENTEAAVKWFQSAAADGDKVANNYLEEEEKRNGRLIKRKRNRKRIEGKTRNQRTVAS